MAATLVPAVKESRDAELVAAEDRVDIDLARQHPGMRRETVDLDRLAVNDVVGVVLTLERREAVLVAPRVVV